MQEVTCQGRENLSWPARAHRQTHPFPRTSQETWSNLPSRRGVFRGGENLPPQTSQHTRQTSSSSLTGPAVNPVKNRQVPVSNKGQTTLPKESYTSKGTDPSQWVSSRHTHTHIYNTQHIHILLQRTIRSWQRGTTTRPGNHSPI